ncbi:MAG: hypothetical protein ACRD18_12005 [Terriglobia bacterium]
MSGRFLISFLIRLSAIACLCFAICLIIFGYVPKAQAQGVCVYGGSTQCVQGDDGCFGCAINWGNAAWCCASGDGSQCSEGN